MTKSEILFELRNHIHFLLPDEIEEIIEGEVEGIIFTDVAYCITFTNSKEFYAFNNGGNKFWMFNNKRHREDGKPALIYANGDKEWWLNGKQYIPDNH